MDALKQKTKCKHVKLMNKSGKQLALPDMAANTCANNSEIIQMDNKTNIIYIHVFTSSVSRRENDVGICDGKSDNVTQNLATPDDLTGGRCHLIHYS